MSFMSFVDCDAKFFGDSCGKHGTYTFYPGLEYNVNGKTHHLMLGSFFNISIESPTRKETPLNLIGELQLVWHDKNHDHEKLSSVKLYAKPEDCPGGRQSHHGRDEILAEEAKVVMRLSDLVGLLLSSTGSRVVKDGNAAGINAQVFHSFSCNNEKCSRVRRPLILSYLQYCRYRAATKRIETVDKRFHNEILSYLLGKSFVQNLPGEGGRSIYFCRDTTTLSELKYFKEELSHLAPRLKGRKRKKKHSCKLLDSDDSNESENWSDHVVLRKNHRTHASSIDFALLNGKSSSSKKKKKKIALEDDLTKDKESFLKTLHQFMKENHSPIYRSPTLGFKEVDLHQFYVSTTKRGGYEEVTRKKLWKEIYDELGGSSCNTSAATGTRKNYEKFLQPFENFLNGCDSKCATRKCNKSKKNASLNKLPSTTIKKRAESETLNIHQSKTTSKVSFNREPLIVIKPCTSGIKADTTSPSLILEMVMARRNVISTGDISHPVTCEPPTSISIIKSQAAINIVPVSLSPIKSNMSNPVSSSEHLYDVKIEREGRVDFLLSNDSQNLSTVSQKLLAGGQALLNTSDAEKPSGLYNHISVESTDLPSNSLEKNEEWRNVLAGMPLPVVSLPLLSTVLSTNSTSLCISHTISQPIPTNKSVKIESKLVKNLEMSDAEDLCVSRNLNSLKAAGVISSSPFISDFKCNKATKWHEFSSNNNEPVDYSMKTLKKLEENRIDLERGLEEPLNLSLKKSKDGDEIHSSSKYQDSFCDMQTPLDLSKSSTHLKEDKQYSSLPINLAQFLPLAFALPMSSNLQVLSPIQQNINMIYNPGSINFPIFSFAPASTCASVQSSG